MSSAAIEVGELRKSYRNGLFRKPFAALQGVSFSVPRGEIFGLLGPNGAGKTTLVKILLGIIRKSGGAASLLDRPAGDRRSRLRVGYLPENLRIASHHSALTALEYYGRLSGLGMADIKARRRELLAMVGLEGRERESIKKYSKGMLQRLGLAQALLHDPELLILDEPTDGLDPLGRSQVRTVLFRLKQQGKTIFLNSHILQEVELVCDRVAILDRGRVRAVGGVDEVARQSVEGIEVEMLVSGDEDKVRGAIDERQVTAWKAMADSRHRLLLRLAHQGEIDACIDALRQNEVSIINLARRRITLEDAFIGLLAESAEPSTPAAAPQQTTPNP